MQQHTTTINGQPAAEVEIERSADHEIPLAELRSHLDARLSKPLVEALAKRGIRTLADLRAAGGIREAAKALDGMRVTSPLARELEAHVQLSVLPTTPSENAELVRAGFTSLDRIADTPLAEFAAAVGAGVAADTVTVVHAAASAQSLLISNLMAEGLVSASYAAGSTTAEALADLTAPVCNCDCRDATSPVAYLADLLDYAVKHLRKVSFVNGLTAEYFGDAAFGSKVLERVDQTIDFTWGAGSPDPALPTDAFSIRWTGSLRPRYTESYTFRVATDDGVRGARLWVDGQLVVDSTSAGSGGTPLTPAARSGQIYLTAGQAYDLKLEYTETGGSAHVSLAWESSSQAREAVPASCLFAVDRTGRIDAAFLEQRFHQPFLGLPERCEYMEQTLRQVRIACEVIRAELPPALSGYEAAWYVEAVYRFLLEQIGTSYEELSKTIAAGDPRARRELASRLAILDRTGAGVLDHLDDLFIDLGQPAQLTELALEQRFGYRATTGPPLDPTREALVVRWRLRNLRRQWLDQDWPQSPPPDAAPLIDPDIVGPPDLKDSTPTLSFPRPPARAMDLLEDRRQWLDQKLIDIGDALDDPAAGFDGLITDTFVDQNGQVRPLLLGIGLTIVQFEDLVKRRREGEDVSADLVAPRLDVESLDFIASARDSGSNLSAADRELLIWAFARHLKREMFPTWRNEERALGLTLSPEHFQIRPAADFPWAPKRFRASEAQRRAVEDRLRMRIEREQAVSEQIDAALEAAEDAFLSELRNDLLRTWALPGTITNAKLAALTDLLQLDMEAGSCELTTRVAQAIETMQSTLFGAREGLLEGRDLVLDDVRRFDSAWRWLGSYATWKAAMRVFLHPENALRPTLRRERTTAFDDLVETLRARGRVTTEDVDAAAREYSVFFRDVCSLTFAGLARVSAPGGDDGREALHLVLAHGGHTGRLYYCAQDARPDWWLAGGFKRSLWNPVPGLDESAEVDAVFSYRTGGRANVALYYVAGGPGARKTGFTRYDGVSWTKPRESGAPVLVASARAEQGLVPATPELAAAGTPGWRVTATDRVVLLDVDGDGRKELMLVAGSLNFDGTRTVGFVREQASGLVLDTIDRIAGGWDLPGSQQVVLRTALVQTPDRYREQLLVVDTGAAELGLLGMRVADGQPAVVAETANGTVPGVAGHADWPVNVQAQFTSADVDGDGLSELVVAEPPATIGSRFYAGRTISPRESGFTHSLADPTFGAAEFPTRVIAVRDPHRARGDLLVVLFAWPGANPGFVANATVTWDLAKNDYTLLLSDGAVAGAGASPLDDDDPDDPSGWAFKASDRVLVFEWDRTSPGGELLLTSGERPETAVAWLRGLEPEIVFPGGRQGSQFQLIWRSTKQIEASADGQGVSWARQLGDVFVAADLNGDGNQELVVVSADHRQVAALTRTADGKLEVTWSQAAQVSGPGGAAQPSWQLAESSAYVAGDIDGDGCEEIVVHAAGRLAVLRGPPPQRSAFDLGVRDQYGPSSVKALDVVNQTSRLWTAERPTEIRNAYQANSGLSGLYFDDPDVPHLDEAYYFVPVELGLRLREAGSDGPALDWLRSVYDHERRLDDRKIAYSLVINGDASYTFVRAADWVSDPLAPHAVAATRKDSYMRYTILTLVRCLLDFADAEFARATSESLPRARELYLKALELLDAPELKERASACQDVLGTIDVTIGDDQERWVWHEVLQKLGELAGYSELVDAVSELRKIMGENGDSGARFAKARNWVETIDGHDGHATNLGRMLARNAAARDDASVALMARTPIAGALEDAGRDAINSLDGPHGHFTHEWVPAPSVSFCIKPNPIVEAFRTHAETNLHKLRSCRSIAGTELHVAPYAGGSAADTATGDGLPAVQPSSFQPLPYRYTTLIERTKQLTELARQMEGSMLAAIQSQDHAEYEEMKARHDMALARSEVRLRDLQVVQADASVRTAELQRQRATITATHYGDLLSAGMTTNEEASLGFLYGAAALHGLSAAASFYGAASVEGVASSESGPLASGLSSLASAASTLSQVFSTYAAHERLEQEWSLQRDLGRQDVRLGSQEIAVAQDQARVAEEERTISALELGHAQEVLDFLTTERKDNADLYEWMSGVLEQIYRFFLQHATSMAKLAEAQLAFERQEMPRAFIGDDYWEPHTDVAQPLPSDGQPADRHGLTGSERLLRDVTELDDYAFRTEQRKLQLTKAISLAQLDPIAFEQFRGTGVLRFATPMSLFDRDFPGHYLRLVRRVRTSVIALIPPTQGIHATLSTTGTSRVVIGGDTFETVVVQRGPESVALTAPLNSTGLFELNPQPEILAPFEGIGVDATWEFVLPKAANLFEYGSIADVLVMVDYTALDNYDYRAQVVQQMDRRMLVERPFMFRHQFADAWYDLHNPDELDDANERMVVRFRTARDDFPPNLEDVSIRNVALYFGTSDGQEVKVESLDFTQNGTTVSSGVVTTDKGVISTRRANGTGLAGVIGLSVDGEWKLSLNYGVAADDQAIRKRFKDDEIEDVVFVITYEGETPAWPE